MDYQDYVKMGLKERKAETDLMRQRRRRKGEKTGVVSVVFATEEKALARQKLQELSEKNPENYYMVYSVPLDNGSDNSSSLSVYRNYQRGSAVRRRNLKKVQNIFYILCCILLSAGAMKYFWRLWYTNGDFPTEAYSLALTV